VRCALIFEQSGYILIKGGQNYVFNTLLFKTQTIGTLEGVHYLFFARFGAMNSRINPYYYCDYYLVVILSKKGTYVKGLGAPPSGLGAGHGAAK
jgi:hypothetical protein